jgi:RNase P/RNase MRP subunit p29
MQQMHRKLFLGLVMAMAVVLFISTKATAIIVDDYNPKLNGVQGKITKIEGNKLTIMSEKGNLITIGIAGKSTDDKHKLRLFKIGDRVKIQDGKLLQLSDLQRHPLQPAGGAAVITDTKGQGSPAQGK